VIWNVKVLRTARLTHSPDFAFSISANSSEQELQQIVLAEATLKYRGSQLSRGIPELKVSPACNINATLQYI